MVRFSILWVGLIVFAAVLHATESDLLDIASREIIVKWRHYPATLDAAELLPGQARAIESVRQILPTEERSSPLSKLVVLRATDQLSAKSILSELTRDPSVEYAELRPIRYTDGSRRSGRDDGVLDVIPDDPYYSQLWGMQAVDAEAAWIETTGDPSVAIAVNDVGVWFGHPELEHARWQNDTELNGAAGVDDDGNGYVDDFYGYDFVGMDGDPTPEPFMPAQSHGTHVSGTAVAARNNGRGIVGIAPDCKLMAVRTGEGEAIIYGYEGILYACRTGVKIINCSWGGSADSQYEREVIQYALDHGCVIVASAGNGNTIERHYPSSLEGVISVAASGLGDVRASFTHYGPSIKVSAPGVNILSTMWDESGSPIYAAWQGTSMAAPLVAGICALVQSKYPTLSGRELASRVIAACDPIDGVNPDYAGWLGLGRVNAWRAVADELEGIRFADVDISELSGNGDQRIVPGETAAIAVSVYNDLSPVDGVVGTISSTEDSIIIGSPVSVYGSVPVGGPFYGGSPFQLMLADFASRKRAITLTVDWTSGAGRSVGRATQQIVVDTSWATVDNGNIRLGFGEDGSLGFHDYLINATLGPGLRVEAGQTQTLFHGSFILGVDGKVADNASMHSRDARFDWRMVDGEYAQFITTDRADQEAKAVFEDRGMEPLEQLFTSVDARALTWNDAAARNFLILEYTVYNHSVNPWTNTYLGFYMDWDIADSEMNLGGYDETGDLAYAKQSRDGYAMIGIASITRPLSAAQTLDNFAEFYPDTMWTDNRKWELLNAGIGTATTEPMDISQLVATGPYELGANSSTSAAFAIVAGMTLEDLRDAATAARLRYGGPVITQKPNPKAETKQSAIYPNPVTGQEKMRLVLAEDGIANVRFYNILGQMVGSYEQVKSGQAGAILDPSRISVASGLLFYSIEVNGEQTLGKLMLLK